MFLNWIGKLFIKTVDRIYEWWDSAILFPFILCLIPVCYSLLMLVDLWLVNPAIVFFIVATTFLLAEWAFHDFSKEVKAKDVKKYGDLLNILFVKLGFILLTQALLGIGYIVYTTCLFCPWTLNWLGTTAWKFLTFLPQLVAVILLSVLEFAFAAGMAIALIYAVVNIVIYWLKLNQKLIVKKKTG